MMNEQCCWYCENGFDENPIDREELVMIDGEPMHRVCARSYQRDLRLEAYDETVRN